MKTFKFLTLLILGLMIFGSAAYFGYALFIKPGDIERREKANAAAAPAPTATPDPGIPGFQRLKKLQESGKLSEARDGWRSWIESNPKSPLLPDAKKQLGDANILLLFQPSSNPTLITYTVAKGDSLAKIASKQHSNAELILKANQLPGINLQIGQQLVIPPLKTSLELDRAAKTLTLLDNGTFLKEYPLLSSPSAPKTPANISSKVIDKVSISGTKRIAFGDKAYANSSRIILLAQAPSIVAAPSASTAALPTSTTQATNTPSGVTSTNSAPAPTPIPMPSGYVLSTEDLVEIFPLVSRNTPVIIH
jgi:LysM repeat protein